MNQPLISVVLLTYNHENFIAEAIQSTLQQSYPHFELIIVDDGSKDRTEEIIRSFEDPRIRYLRQENQGPSVALNSGISHAKGEYIAIFSGDDVNFNNRLEVQLREAQKANKKAIFSHVLYIDEKGNQISSPGWLADCFNIEQLSRAKILRNLFEKGNFLNASVSFFKKEVLQLAKIAHSQIGPFDPLLIQLQDFDLWIRLIKQYDFHIIEEPLLKYRIRNDDQNLSAPSEKALNRGRIENFLINAHFFKDISDELFKEAFGDRLKKIHFQTMTERKIEEALLFLDLLAPQMKLEGIRILADLFSKSENLATLKEYGFTPLSFSKLLHSVDIFSNKQSFTSLYYDLGESFCEKNRIFLKTNPYSEQFNFSFDLSALRGVKTVRWDPIEKLFCEIELKEVILVGRDKKRRQFDLNQVIHNGHRISANSWVFPTEDPNLIFQSDFPLSAIEFSGKWHFLEKHEVDFKILQHKESEVPSTSRQPTQNKVVRMIRRVKSSLLGP